MDELKCKNCGAVLVEQDGQYICPFCGAVYQKKVQDITQTIVYNINSINNVEMKTDPRRLVVSDSITTIGKGAYKNNLLLEEVIFSSNTLSIQESAFEGCINLKSIKNFDSVKYIGDYAFKGSGLSEIIIGKNVERIGKEAFALMPNLTKVIYKPNKNIRLKDTFIKCPRLTQVLVDKRYFFPALVSFVELRNNPDNIRPTIKDAFWNTPYYAFAREKLYELYSEGICPDCGGYVRKGLFQSRCTNCGIDLKDSRR